MRRTFSFVVALGLAGLGPLPVTPCALAHSQASECATLQTRTDCERMGMNQAEKPSVKVSPASKTCCAMSEAPLPEVQIWSGDLHVATAPAAVSEAIAETVSNENPGFSDLFADLSSPPLQPLLCTFLN